MTALPVAPLGRQPGASVLPDPRGPLSSALVHALARRPGPLCLPDVRSVDPLDDDDLQLALYCCYELHYRGFAGVDEEWEWWPPLLIVRRRLERLFADSVADEVGTATRPTARGVIDELRDLAAGRGGPSLSQYMAERGTLQEMREFCVHRSAYQLKEADPHTWAIPRLSGAAKAALVAIQADEYGQGRAAAMHAALFAVTMEALGLDPTYGAYVDLLPAATLATVNLVSMFGLHRRWRGALVGHLALFEMTSVVPMSRYSSALERLGVAAAARAFYDAHTRADEVHAVVALDEMVAGFVDAEPARASDVVFGARAVAALEARFASGLLDAWQRGRTSLRVPLP